MVCNNCGTENLENAVYCENCGQPLSAVITAEDSCQEKTDGNGLALASMIVGIAATSMSFTPYTALFGIGGGITALMLRKKALEKGTTRTGRAMAAKILGIASIITSGVVLTLFLSFLLAYWGVYLISVLYILGYSY